MVKRGGEGERKEKMGGVYYLITSGKKREEASDCPGDGGKGPLPSPGLNKERRKEKERK